MTRRVLALIAVLAVAALACSSPAAPAVSDPKDIVAQSLDALGKAKTFHLKADITGTLPFNLGSLLGGGGLGASPEPGASGGTMDLSGTGLEATVDIAGKQAQVSATLPALLGMKLDVIALGNTSYVKISLLGDKWSKTVSTPAPGASPEASPSDSVEKAISEMKKTLSATGVTVEKLADEKCGDADCYHVKVTATPDALKGAASGVLPSGIPGVGSEAPGASPLLSGNVTFELWSRKSDLRPVKVVIGATTSGATITATVVIDKYDEAVSISAPPADQVTDQPPFSIPSFEVPSLEIPSIAP